jgi:hypothetical protein
MQDGLLDTLLAHNPRISSRGNIDWLTVLDSCVQDPETVDLLRQIPASERRALLAEAGRTVYRQDLGNFAAELAYNTDFVVASGQLPGFAEQREDHAACLFAWLSDAIDFSSRASAEAHLAEAEVELAGREHLEPFLGQRGILLLSVFQSHIGYALPLLTSLRHVAIIRKPEAGEGPGLPAQLLDWQDCVEVVPADASGGIRLFQILRKAGVVGLYNDFLYEDARSTPGLLFGRKVPISRTLLRLIQSTRAVVLPITVARSFPLESSRVQVRVFSPLSASLEGGNEPALAIQISIATEALIRRFPRQWRLWNTLQTRWAAGADLA